MGEITQKSKEKCMIEKTRISTHIQSKLMVEKGAKGFAYRQGRNRKGSFLKNCFHNKLLTLLKYISI